METPRVLNADELNAIAKSSGYTGGPFSSVGLPASPGSRNLNLTAGNPVGQIQQGQVQSNQVGNTASNGVDTFNTAIMGLLQKYQKMGTKPFVDQGLDASQEQTNRISAPTSPDMVGASPAQQNSVRSNSAQAIQPTISSANDSAQTFGEQLRGFGDAVNSAKSFMTTYQTQQEKMKTDAQSILHDAISSGSDAVAALLKSQPDLVKVAGYNNETLQGVITGLKKSEAQNAYKTYGNGTPTSSMYVKGENPVVDAWVQNINSGKSKLSDITAADLKANPGLKSLVAQGLATAQSSTSSILDTTKASLKELNDMVTNDQGFKGSVGSKLSFGTLGGIFPGGLAGTSEANFNGKLKQVVNDVVLPNLTLLHGLGRVTDREFQALSSSLTSLSTNLSEGAFKSELKNITDRINSLSDAGNGPGVTPSGIKYTITK